MKKIDIHCHILPDLDDGAKNEEESIRMLRMAYEQGICSVIATSHASVQFPKSHPDVIRDRCRILEEKAKRELDPDFRIYPGQEILFTESVPDRLEKGELLTLAGSSSILVEFLPSISYTALYQGIRKLLLSPYRPILAHMERYCALRTEGRVDELIRAGVRMQMNYRPVGGRWYEETTRWCKRMLKEGNVHFLATDMHHADDRAPKTMEAMRWLERHLEDTYIEEICFRNAEGFLLGIENR